MTRSELLARFPKASAAFIAANSTPEAPPKPKRRTLKAITEAEYTSGLTVCAQCQTPFKSFPSMNRKFCSSACAYSNKERTETIAQKQTKIRPETKCEGCGVMFRHKTNRSSRHCTIECFRTHSAGKHWLGVKPPVKERTKFSQIKCKNCGVLFGAWDAAERVFCSRGCSVGHPDTTRKASQTFSAGKNRVKQYSRARKGWAELGQRRFFARSSWEFNYGHYLEFLRIQKQISDWAHEPETFWFDGIKRGCLSYLPDFRVTNPDGTIEYHEVKGWMDPKSITKIKRMAKYHPAIKLVVIDATRYKALAKTVKGLVPEWK